MILYCDLSRCKNCADGMCEMNTLRLEYGECRDYFDVTDGPDYKEPYFEALEYRFTDGRVGLRYRQRRYGKRVEYEGLVLYTRDDIRAGIAEAYFTEANTGYLVSGKSLLDPEKLREIKRNAKIYTRVMSLPWMDYDPGAGEPSPHVEEATS